MNAENLSKKYNVSFVGSRFVGREFHWHQFRREHKDFQAIQEYRRLIDAIRAHPLTSTEEMVSRFEGLHLTGGDILSLINDLSAEKRIGVLSCIADLGLELWGTDEWLTSGGECAELYLAYHPEKIFSLNHNSDLYNSSKVCINVNHLQAVSAFSWRVCDIMASTGCLLSEYRPNLDTLFPKIPIPTFSNKYEAREQCQRLLSDERRRKEISLQCQQVIEQRFRFVNVLSTLEQMTGCVLTTPGRKGSVTYLDSAAFAPSDMRKRSHRLSLALQCLKLATAQIPGCSRLFNKDHCVKRIVNYTDYQSE